MLLSRLTISILLAPLLIMASSWLGARADMPGQALLVTRDTGSLTLRLPIDQPAPFRAFTLENPRRLVVDMGTSTLPRFSEDFVQDIPEFSAVRYGLFRLDNARMVLDMNRPMVIDSAEMRVIGGQGPVIAIRLVPTSAAEFSHKSAAPEGNTWAISSDDAVVEGAAGRPLIAIDAGHGGIDQGAVVDGLEEKVITLQMARKMRDVLLEDGSFRVMLTRDSDVFVPLGARVEIARRAGAVAYISLHADVVTRGRARGTTVFSLSHADADQEAVTIATLENRGDLVAGISVEGEDDQITSVLLQLAHRETDALSNRFADVMAEALWFQNDSEIKSRRMAGGFRVLRAPDIPSVLIEMGFMSDASDLEKLQDPEWQLSMAETLRAGLRNWLAIEADMRGLLRN